MLFLLAICFGELLASTQAGTFSFSMASRMTRLPTATAALGKGLSSKKLRRAALMQQRSRWSEGSMSAAATAGTMGADEAARQAVGHGHGQARERAVARGGGGEARGPREAAGRLLHGPGLHVRRALAQGPAQTSQARGRAVLSRRRRMHHGSVIQLVLTV